MELIHIKCERDIFKLLDSNKNNSLENLASKQKTFRIVKEQTMRLPASPLIARRIA